jgi:hypothetical protein
MPVRKTPEAEATATLALVTLPGQDGAVTQAATGVG